jgi:hypothetical protein
MDDYRYIWLRDKVFGGLDINEFDVFDEFIVRDEGDNEMKIAKFMNQTEEDEDNALIFHKEVKEEEIEVTVELSNYKICLINQSMNFKINI